MKNRDLLERSSPGLFIQTSSGFIRKYPFVRDVKSLYPKVTSSVIVTTRFETYFKPHYRVSTIINTYFHHLSNTYIEDIEDIKTVLELDLISDFQRYKVNNNADQLLFYRIMVKTLFHNIACSYRKQIETGNLCSVDFYNRIFCANRRIPSHVKVAILQQVLDLARYSQAPYFKVHESFESKRINVSSLRGRTCLNVLCHINDASQVIKVTTDVHTSDAEPLERDILSISFSSKALEIVDHCDPIPIMC